MSGVVPLNAVATLSRDVVEPTTVAEQLMHFSIPALQGGGAPVIERSADILSAKFRIIGGEILISKLNPRKNLVIQVPRELPMPAVASTEFVIIHPTAIDARFLFYLLSSENTCQWLDSNVRSVTRSHQRVEPEFVAHLRIKMPSEHMQRRIADFLDDQVARIDNIIAARRAQVLALGSLAIACADETLAVTAAPMRRLGSLLALGAVGVVVNPSSYFVEEGVPFVHGYNVRDGFLDLSDLKRMTAADSAALSRSRLRGGDVLVVRAGYPGRAAVVPQELAGGNCASVLLLRPAPILESDWLEAFFNSVVGKRQVELVQYGAAQGVINLGDVRDFEIPLPSVAVQRVLLHQLRESRSSLRTASDLLRNAEIRMEELKRSLITAAVTGEFDTSTADGSRVSA